MTRPLFSPAQLVAAAASIRSSLLTAGTSNLLTLTRTIWPNDGYPNRPSKVDQLRRALLGAGYTLHDPVDKSPSTWYILTSPNGDFPDDTAPALPPAPTPRSRQQAMDNMLRARSATLRNL